MQPRCQLPAPAVCCGRCLAVPWQHQNRMCLWIEAGTSPRSQAAHAVPFPKGLLQRTTGVHVAGRAMFISRERQSPGPLSSEASGAGAGGDVYAQRVGVLLPLLQAAWVCFPWPFREMLRQCVGVGGRGPLTGSDLWVGLNHCLPHCSSNYSQKDYFVPGPVLSTLCNK